MQKEIQLTDKNLIGGGLKQISIMSKWTEEEIEHLMMCVEASDDETMEEMYEYVHHMMYKEGNHPDFPVRTLSAVTAKIRKMCRERGKK